MLEEQGEDDSTSWKFFLVGFWVGGLVLWSCPRGKCGEMARKETGEPASIERFGTPDQACRRIWRSGAWATAGPTQPLEFRHVVSSDG